MEEDETPGHILNDCPAVASERLQLQLETEAKYKTREEAALKFMKIKSISEIYERNKILIAT